MAENTQTFILVGDFKDNITPSLRKLDREIGNLTRSFTKMQAKLRPISRDLAVMSESATRISQAFKGQRGSVESSIRSLQQYRKEAGKVKAANEQLARSAKGIGGGAPRSPRGVGGGGAGGGGMPPGLASAAGGFVAGQGLANMMTNSIVAGFRLGTKIMVAPFQYGARAIGERIQDEMSDIKSAGGMFAVDRRENMGIFKDLQAARNFQEELNAKLAQSAAALPGETAEYVQQAKQLTDTVMLSLAKNQGEFVKFAKELDPAVKSSTDAMATVLQQFTEKAVLLGQGESQGIYGVPQILEMLVSQEQVNVNAFNRFGAYMRNPLLKNALQNAEKELQKTGANTAERFRVIQKVLNEAVPNEVVMDMTNSAEGIIQAIKSGFLDPESGLLGLGRKLDIAMPKVDSLGRYINEAGDVVATAAEAAKGSASVFEVLKQTVGGFVLPLAGIMDVLPEIYEPLAGLATGFMDLRNVSQEFYAAFNSYTKYYENEAKKFAEMAAAAQDAGRESEAAMLSAKSTAIAKRAKLGGTLNALNDLLVAFGAIDEKKYAETAQKLLDIENINPGQMVAEMLGQFFNSDVMKMIGEAIGSFVGSVLKAVGDLMSGASSLAEAGPFAEGLQKGFQKAKGGQGIALIFKSLFSLIGKTLMTVFKSAPVEMSILTALTVGLPILQGAITAGLTKIFSLVAAQVGTIGLTGGAGGIGATISGWLGAIGPALGLIARILPPVAAILAGMVLLGGGVENTMRQLSEVFGQVANGIQETFGGLIDLFTELMTWVGEAGKAIIWLTTALVNLTTGSEFVAESFDLLKFALVPLTATFDLLEMSARLLIEGFANARAFLTNLNPFASKEEKEAANADAREAADKRNEARRKDDVYYTSMRYGGAANYAAVLEKDVAAKQRDLEKAGLLKAERKKLNDELFALNKTLAEARRQAGQKPAPSSSTPSAPKPQPAPKPAPSPRSGKPDTRPKPTPTPATPKPVAPPAAPAMPAAPKPVAPPAAVIKPESLKPVQQAVATGTAATQGVSKAVTTSGNQVTNAVKSQPNPVPTAISTAANQIVAAIQAQPNQVPAAIATATTQVIASLQSHALTTTTTINALGTTLQNLLNALKAEMIKQATIQHKKSDVLIAGINSVKSALMAISTKVSTEATLQQVSKNTAKTNTLLESGKLKVTFSLGAGPKGGPGQVDAFTPVATTQFGLQVTSGYRPGDPGYHGVNRARDYSNGSGPTPQMMAFAQYMASNFGGALSELIYTPLGFGIKNGQVVPPYATANHYDHVHVALANGPELPRLFTTAAAAANYERMMAPPGARVATVTANSSEFAGGTGSAMNLTQNITVNGALDPQATAEAVWEYTSKRVQQLQANSFA